MSSIYNVNEKLHKIRAKLYKNHLHTGEGYIARNANEASVNVADICASMKNRAGYQGAHEEALQTVRHFFNEMMYQLADGFSVNLGFGAIHPNIGGIFESDREPFDPEKHPITYRFQPLKALRNLSSETGVIIEGYADTNGKINEYANIDRQEVAVNTIFVPGSQFIISGDKIKVAGGDPANGVYMVPVEDPSKALKLDCIAENSSGKIIGLMHKSTGYLRNRVEIRTQYAGSGTLLKSPRIITSSFILEEN
jgi:hypothetical protein